MRPLLPWIMAQLVAHHTDDPLGGDARRQQPCWLWKLMECPVPPLSPPEWAVSGHEDYFLGPSRMDPRIGSGCSSSLGSISLDHLFIFKYNMYFNVSL